MCASFSESLFSECFTTFSLLVRVTFSISPWRCLRKQPRPLKPPSKRVVGTERRPFSACTGRARCTRSVSTARRGFGCALQPEYQRMGAEGHQSRLVHPRSAHTHDEDWVNRALLNGTFGQFPRSSPEVSHTYAAEVVACFVQ